MVEECRCGEKPAREQQAGQVANQDQRTQRDGQHIGRRAHRGHDVKVVGHQRQGADPGRKGGERQVADKQRRYAQGFLPAWTQLVGQQWVWRGQAAAKLPQGLQRENLRAGL